MSSDVYVLEDCGTKAKLAKKILLPRLYDQDSRLVADKNGNLVVILYQQIFTYTTYHLYSLSISDEKISEIYNLEDIHEVTTPSIGFDGTIYFCATDPGPQPGEPGRCKLWAVNPTGKLKWQPTILAYQAASSITPLIDDNKEIICFTDAGIAAVNLENGKEIWSFDGIYSPAFGNLNIGSDGNIYAISGAVGGGIALHAIKSSSTGLDTRAPWLKENKDIYNSNNAATTTSDSIKP